MSVIISAPTQGSLRIDTVGTSASPAVQFLCNLKTVSVNGDFGSGNVSILNMNGQPLVQIPYKSITNIGASGANFGNQFTLTNAIQAVASLIITT